MPAGDASLERQALKPLNMHGPDDDGKVHADCPKCQASVRRLQDVVDAQREALTDIAGAASNRTPKTAMRYMARTAREALDKAQAAQPEGERA
jgi:hypothetical protein